MSAAAFFLVVSVSSGKIRRVKPISVMFLMLLVLFMLVLDLMLMWLMLLVGIDIGIDTVVGIGQCVGGAAHEGGRALGLVLVW